MISHSVIIILAALIPAAALMVFIYRKDSIEKEPAGLLIKLALLGVGAAFTAMLPEEIFDDVLNSVFRDGNLKSIISAFIGVACVEEGTKLILLTLGSWKNKAFNYKFDGIVYAVFVGVGFSAVENLLYFTDSGLGLIPTRTLLSLPGHMSFAVYMGLYYGKAKVCEAAGDLHGKRANLCKAYLFPVVFHGIYDACLFIQSVPSILIFIVFVIVFYITVFKKISYEAARDSLIDPKRAVGFFDYLFTGAVTRGNIADDSIPNDPNYTSGESPEDIQKNHRYTSENK